jgi:glutamate racemase
MKAVGKKRRPRSRAVDGRTPPPSARRAPAAVGPAREAPIGVFDSGIGGLTVVHAIRGLLPRENILYLGDTARIPYGTRSAETVRRYAGEMCDMIVDRGVKALVIACNTVSAVALDAVVGRYAIPVLGVIAPSAEEAVRVSRSKRIGVIATEATIKSGAYTRALRALDPKVEVYTRACPLFVPLVEEGWVDNDVARGTAKVYLSSLRQSGIDTLILGCTHYPLLRGLVAEIMGSRVKLVDSSPTARALQALLRARRLERRGDRGSMSFFVTDAPERFIQVGGRFLGSEVDSAVRIER